MATRREFLLGAAAIAVSGATSAFADTPALMSAARVNNRDGGALWRQDGFASFDLPGRGHAMARRAGSSDVVLVGRRPGVFAAIVDASNAQARPRIITPATKAEMKRVLDDIQSGKFARDWVLENKAGQTSFKATRARGDQHPIEEVGKKLRAMMPWIAKNKLVDTAKN